MNHISRLLGCALAALAFAIVISSTPARAQDQSANADPKLQAAAQKAFKAFADQNADTLASMTVRRYQRKVTKDSLRPVATGPKLQVVYDGKVEVLRADPKEAVVQANMFQPSGKDVPVVDASKLDLFMVKEGENWLIDAPNKKQAASDATMAGGWFHPGRFTYCPNSGLQYQGSHFSDKLEDRSTAVCR